MSCKRRSRTLYTNYFHDCHRLGRMGRACRRRIVAELKPPPTLKVVLINDDYLLWMPWSRSGSVSSSFRWTRTKARAVCGRHTRVRGVWVFTYEIVRDQGAQSDRVRGDTSASADGQR